MLEHKVLIVEACTVDALATSAVVVGEVTTLVVDVSHECVLLRLLS